MSNLFDLITFQKSKSGQVKEKSVDDNNDDSEGVTGENKSKQRSENPSSIPNEEFSVSRLEIAAPNDKGGPSVANENKKKDSTLTIPSFDLDTLKQFTIPKKKKVQKELLQDVGIESREFKREVLPAIQQSLKDRNSQKNFRYTKVQMVHSQNLTDKYLEKRKEMRQMNYTEKETADSYAFLCVENDEVAKNICLEGVNVGNVETSVLGNATMGVSLCRHADILKPEAILPNSRMKIIVFKIMKGKVKPMVENREGEGFEPTPNFDCHVAKTANIDLSNVTVQNAFEATQIYLYGYDEDFSIEDKPRQICPFAVVDFIHTGEVRVVKTPLVKQTSKTSSTRPSLQVNIPTQLPHLRNINVQKTPKDTSPRVTMKYQQPPTYVMPQHSAPKPSIVTNTTPLEEVQKEPKITKEKLLEYKDPPLKKASKIDHSVAKIHPSVGKDGPDGGTVVWAGSLCSRNTEICKVEMISYGSNIKPFRLGCKMTILSKMSIQSARRKYFSTLTKLHKDKETIGADKFYNYCELRPDFTDQSAFNQVMTFLAKTPQTAAVVHFEDSVILIMTNCKSTQELGVSEVGYHPMILHCMFISNMSRYWNCMHGDTDFHRETTNSEFFRFSAAMNFKLNEEILTKAFSEQIEIQDKKNIEIARSKSKAAKMKVLLPKDKNAKTPTTTPSPASSPLVKPQKGIMSSSPLTDSNQNKMSGSSPRDFNVKVPSQDPNPFFTQGTLQIQDKMQLGGAVYSKMSSPVSSNVPTDPRLAKRRPIVAQSNFQPSQTIHTETTHELQSNLSSSCSQESLAASDKSLQIEKQGSVGSTTPVISGIEKTVDATLINQSPVSSRKQEISIVSPELATDPKIAQRLVQAIQKKELSNDEALIQVNKALKDLEAVQAAKPQVGPVSLQTLNQVPAEPFYKSFLPHCESAEDDLSQSENTAVDSLKDIPPSPPPPPPPPKPTNIPVYIPTPKKDIPLPKSPSVSSDEDMLEEEESESENEEEEDMEYGHPISDDIVDAIVKQPLMRRKHSHGSKPHIPSSSGPNLEELKKTESLIQEETRRIASLKSGSAKKALESESSPGNLDKATKTKDSSETVDTAQDMKALLDADLVIKKPAIKSEVLKMKQFLDSQTTELPKERKESHGVFNMPQQDCRTDKADVLQELPQKNISQSGTSLKIIPLTGGFVPVLDMKTETPANTNLKEYFGFDRNDGTPPGLESNLGQNENSSTDPTASLQDCDYRNFKDMKFESDIFDQPCNETDTSSVKSNIMPNQPADSLKMETMSQSPLSPGKPDQICAISSYKNVIDSVEQYGEDSKPVFQDIKVELDASTDGLKMTFKHDPVTYIPIDEDNKDDAMDVVLERALHRSHREEQSAIDAQISQEELEDDKLFCRFFYFWLHVTVQEYLYNEEKEKRHIETISTEELLNQRDHTSTRNDNNDLDSDFLAMPPPSWPQDYKSNAENLFPLDKVKSKDISTTSSVKACKISETERDMNKKDENGTLVKKENTKLQSADIKTSEDVNKRIAEIKKRKTQRLDMVVDRMARGTIVQTCDELEDYIGTPRVENNSVLDHGDENNSGTLPSKDSIHTGLDAMEGPKSLRPIDFHSKNVENTDISTIDIEIKTKACKNLMRRKEVREVTELKKTTDETSRDGKNRTVEEKVQKVSSLKEGKCRGVIISDKIFQRKQSEEPSQNVCQRKVEVRKVEAKPKDDMPSLTHEGQEVLKRLEKKSSASDSDENLSLPNHLQGRLGPSPSLLSTGKKIKLEKTESRFSNVDTEEQSRKRKLTSLDGDILIPNKMDRKEARSARRDWSPIRTATETRQSKRASERKVEHKTRSPVRKVERWDRDSRDRMSSINEIENVKFSEACRASLNIKEINLDRTQEKNSEVKVEKKCKESRSKSSQDDRRIEPSNRGKHQNRFHPYKKEFAQVSQVQKNFRPARDLEELLSCLTAETFRQRRASSGVKPMFNIFREKSNNRARFRGHHFRRSSIEDVRKKLRESKRIHAKSEVEDERVVKKEEIKDFQERKERAKKLDERINTESSDRTRDPEHRHSRGNSPGDSNGGQGKSVLEREYESMMKSLQITGNTNNFNQYEEFNLNFGKADILGKSKKKEGGGAGGGGRKGKWPGLIYTVDIRYPPAAYTPHPDVPMPQLITSQVITSKDPRQQKANLHSGSIYLHPDDGQAGIESCSEYQEEENWFAEDASDEMSRSGGSPRLKVRVRNTNYIPKQRLAKRSRDSAANPPDCEAKEKVNKWIENHDFFSSSEKENSPYAIETPYSISQSKSTAQKNKKETTLKMSKIKTVDNPYCDRNSGTHKYQKSRHFDTREEHYTPRESRGWKKTSTRGKWNAKPRWSATQERINPISDNSRKLLDERKIPFDDMVDSTGNDLSLGLELMCNGRDIELDDLDLAEEFTHLQPLSLGTQLECTLVDSNSVKRAHMETLKDWQSRKPLDMLVYGRLNIPVLESGTLRPSPKTEETLRECMKEFQEEIHTLVEGQEKRNKTVFSQAACKTEVTSNHIFNNVSAHLDTLVNNTFCLDERDKWPYSNRQDLYEDKTIQSNIGRGRGYRSDPMNGRSTRQDYYESDEYEMKRKNVRESQNHEEVVYKYDVDYRISSSASDIMSDISESKVFGINFNAEKHESQEKKGTGTVFSKDVDLRRPTKSIPLEMNVPGQVEAASTKIDTVINKCTQSFYQGIDHVLTNNNLPEFSDMRKKPLQMSARSEVRNFAEIADKLLQSPEKAADIDERHKSRSKETNSTDRSKDEKSSIVDESQKYDPYEPTEEQTETPQKKKAQTEKSGSGDEKDENSSNRDSKRRKKSYRQEKEKNYRRRSRSRSKERHHSPAKESRSRRHRSRSSSEERRRSSPKRKDKPRIPLAKAPIPFSQLPKKQNLGGKENDKDERKVKKIDTPNENSHPPSRENVESKNLPSKDPEKSKEVESAKQSLEEIELPKGIPPQNSKPPVLENAKTTNNGPSAKAQTLQNRVCYSDQFESSCVDAYNVTPVANFSDIFDSENPPPGKHTNPYSLCWIMIEHFLQSNAELLQFFGKTNEKELNKVLWPLVLELKERLKTAKERQYSDCMEDLIKTEEDSAVNEYGSEVKDLCEQKSPTKDKPVGIQHENSMEEVSKTQNQGTGDDKEQPKSPEKKKISGLEEPSPSKTQDLKKSCVKSNRLMQAFRQAVQLKQKGKEPRRTTLSKLSPYIAAKRAPPRAAKPLFKPFEDHSKNKNDWTQICQWLDDETPRNLNEVLVLFYRETYRLLKDKYQMNVPVKAPTFLTSKDIFKYSKGAFGDISADQVVKKSIEEEKVSSHEEKTVKTSVRKRVFTSEPTVFEKRYKKEDTASLDKKPKTLVEYRIGSKGQEIESNTKESGNETAGKTIVSNIHFSDSADGVKSVLEKKNEHAASTDFDDIDLDIFAKTRSPTPPPPNTEKMDIDGRSNETAKPPEKELETIPLPGSIMPPLPPEPSPEQTGLLQMPVMQGLPEDPNDEYYTTEEYRIRYEQYQQQLEAYQRQQDELERQKKQSGDKSSHYPYPSIQAGPQISIPPISIPEGHHQVGHPYPTFQSPAQVPVVAASAGEFYSHSGTPPPLPEGAPSFPFTEQAQNMPQPYVAPDMNYTQQEGWGANWDQSQYMPEGHDPTQAPIYPNQWSDEWSQWQQHGQQPDENWNQIPQWPQQEYGDPNQMPHGHPHGMYPDIQGPGPEGEHAFGPRGFHGPMPRHPGFGSRPPMRPDMYRGRLRHGARIPRPRGPNRFGIPSLLDLDPEFGQRGDGSSRRHVPPLLSMPVNEGKEDLDQDPNLAHLPPGKHIRFYVCNPERAISKSVVKFLNFMGATAFDPYNLEALQAMSHLEVLVLIHNKDKEELERIPNLFGLKRKRTVKFVMYDSVFDIKLQQYIPIMEHGGKIMVDTVSLLQLRPDALDLLCDFMVKERSIQIHWTLLIHSSTFTELEKLRSKADTSAEEIERLAEIDAILKTYHPKNVVEFLNAHECDSFRKPPHDFVACASKNLPPLAHYRHCLFMTNFTIDEGYTNVFHEHGIGVLSTATFLREFVGINPPPLCTLPDECLQYGKHSSDAFQDVQLTNSMDKIETTDN